MSGTPAVPGGRGQASWTITGGVAAARGLVLCGLMLTGAVVATLAALPLVLLGLGVGFLVEPPGSMPVGLRLLPFAGLIASLLLLPAVVRAARWVTGPTRLLAGRWCGVAIPVPYRPPGSRAAGNEVGRGRVVYARWRWLLADPASWRDVAWLVLNAGPGWLVAALPAALVGVGLVEFAGPAAGLAIPPPAFPGNTRIVLAVIGITMATTGLVAAPSLLRAHGIMARSLLAPAGRARLNQRIDHLAQTRAETIDAGAAELRRIERDLHDGAQARLVAMGMTLDAAGVLIEDSPAAARALLYEARDASTLALAELRDLVRGIHPPVLADRGLTDAVRALTLSNPLRIHLDGVLPGRPAAAVESAGYFAVSELLANAVKHAGATEVWVDLRYSGGMLRIGVTDNGAGGADPARGSGLRGIERRIAAFDGVLALTSPAGGPTAVTMEIPCVLSSPKTTSCSATA